VFEIPFLPSLPFPAFPGEAIFPFLCPPLFILSLTPLFFVSHSRAFYFAHIPSRPYVLERKIEVTTRSQRGSSSIKSSRQLGTSQLEAHTAVVPMEPSHHRRNVSETGLVSGTKRPASLLPAFEPLSSSPSLPRPQKRVARGSLGDMSTYPTPVPTSSTHFLSSSPPRNPLSRPKLQRNSFTASERMPLSAVPTIMLPDSGEPILMGRSSASCHHQLSANKSISRVHVKAAYKPPGNQFDLDRIEIMCLGWNGLKLHCQGKTYDVEKDTTFTSDLKDADILIDVQGARVLIQWPRHERKDSGSFDSDQTWDESPPKRTMHSMAEMQESPLMNRHRLVSPISPSPAVRALVSPSSSLPVDQSHNPVVVYEDEPSPIEHAPEDPPVESQTQPSSLDSELSELGDLSKAPDEFSDHDEENDPIIHSFGPFGENLLPRIASFRAGESPIRPIRPLRPQPAPLKPSDSPPQPSAAKTERNEIKNNDTKEMGPSAAIQNHIVNQLAFSRLSSTPFSVILNNLPPGLWAKDSSWEGLSKQEIQSILEATGCIGEVSREGKDAAGKPLENEYYYIPDHDEDQMRREAVVNDLRKPGLRSCRKQHKVWRPFPSLTHRLVNIWGPSNTSGANQNRSRQATAFGQRMFCWRDIGMFLRFLLGACSTVCLFSFFLALSIPLLCLSSIPQA
jgi:hypothetical protein